MKFKSTLFILLWPMSHEVVLESLRPAHCFFKIISPLPACKTTLPKTPTSCLCHPLLSLSSEALLIIRLQSHPTSQIHKGNGDPSHSHTPEVFSKNANNLTLITMRIKAVIINVTPFKGSKVYSYPLSNFTFIITSLLFFFFLRGRNRFKEVRLFPIFPWLNSLGSDLAEYNWVPVLLSHEFLAFKIPQRMTL